MADQDLTYDRLVSGDRPSILALGVSGAESIKHTRMAVFMVDALGRVQLMPASAIEVKAPPKVRPEELDQLDEGRAIEVMLSQGDPEDAIIRYLRGRETRKGMNGD